MDSLSGKTILHIGNIANNAYNSAAYERRLGLNSFAISPNYLHVMAFPFWETEELIVDPEKTFEPDPYISKDNMPEWFLYGTWQEVFFNLQEQLSLPSIETLNQVASDSTYREVKSKLVSVLLKHGRSPLKRVLPSKVRHWLSNSLLVQLRRESYVNYSRIFDLADILVFYGAHNAYVEISNWKGHYISLEHGTLRDYINSDFYFAKKSKSAYQKSFRTIVTNQDCLEPARKLGIESGHILKSPHPSSDFDIQDLRNLRLETLKSSPIEIFSPTRHSYGSIVDRGKGNQEAIEGILKALVEYPNLRATFVEWGDDVEKSKKLIRELNLQDKIEWTGVLSRKSVKLRMAKALVVLDQFLIPAYGGITADAIAIGVPVITRQDIESDVHFFGTAAPVLGAQNAAEIFQRISLLVENNATSKEIFVKSVEWYDANLSSSVAFERRKSAYLDRIGLNKPSTQ